MRVAVAGQVLVETVARRLGPLRREVAFLGGAAVSLLLSDEGAPEVRSTMDVDVIAEVASRLAYYRLADRLRELGFREVSDEGAPVCRWEVGGVLVDVMPTLPDVLGFSNRWYAEAFAAATEGRIAKDLVIRLVPHRTSWRRRSRPSVAAEGKTSSQVTTWRTSSRCLTAGRRSWTR